MSSGSASFRGGNYESKVNIKVDKDALKDIAELDKELDKVSDTLSKMARGRDISALWNEQAASIQNVSRALEEYAKNQESANNVQFAEELTKAMNAFRAFNPDMQIADIFKQLGNGAEELITKADQLSVHLDSAFSVNSLRDAFSAFEALKSAGADLNTIFQKLNQDDASGLEATLKGVRQELEFARMEMEGLRRENEALASGVGVKKLKSDLSIANEMIDDLTRKASREVNTFLEANGLYRFKLDDRYFDFFDNLFMSIETGSMSAGEAISEIKVKFQDFFSSGELSMADEMMNKFALLTDMVTELSTKMTSVLDSIGSSGFSAIQSDMVEAAEQGASALRQEGEAFRQVADDGQGLKAVADAVSDLASRGNTGINETKDALTQLLTSIKELGEIDNSKLANISNALASLSDMNGFSASKKATEDIALMIQKIAAIPDVSSIKALSGVDLTNFKMSGASLEKMATYLPQIAQINTDSLKSFADIQWGNLKDFKVSQATVDNLSKLKDVFNGTTGQFTFDEATLSGLSTTIQDAIQAASANIKLTINNVEFSASAQSALAKAAEEASAGTKSATGKTTGGKTQAIEDETSALEKETEALWKQHEAWDNVQRAMMGTRESGWKKAAQMVKEDEAIEKEAAAMMKAADDAEEASLRIREAREEISGGGGGGGASATEAGEGPRRESEELENLISLYEQYYNLRAQEASAINRNVEANADLYNSRAQVIWEEIAAIEAENPALAELAGAHERVTAAVRNSQTAINNADASETISEAKNEAQALDDLVAKYQQYYAFKSKQITATNKADIENADVYRARAEALWEEISAIEEDNQKLAELAAGHEKVIAAVQKYQEIVNRGQRDSDNAMAKRMQDEAKALETYKKQLDGLGLNTSGIKFSADSEAVNRYSNELAELERRFEAIKSAALNEKVGAIEAFEEQKQKVTELRNELNAAAQDTKNMESTQKKATALANKIDLWAESNPKAYANAKDYIDQWVATLRSAEPVAKSTFDAIDSGFKNISAQEKLAGNNGQTFFQTLKAGWSKFGGWSIVSRSFMSVIRIFKQAVTAVKEVDSAMTELKKVTDLTSEGYNKFYDNAASMAGEVGSKLSDVINSVADFSRLGYEIADATELSRAAMVYMNVGDSIENVDEATSSLISTMKAFGLSAEDSMSIVDKFNEVGKTLLPMPVVTRCLAECYIGQSSIALCA